MIARALREVRAVAMAVTPTHRHLRDRLIAAFWVTLAVDVLASVAVYLADHHAKQSEIHTVGSAAFWVTCQLLTVSSNLPNPVSAGARVVDVGLEIWAISAVGYLAGSMGAFFHRRSQERAPMGAQASSD